MAILFDDEVIVADIERTQAGGLSGYTHGNGVRQTISLDGRGRIAQLQALAQGARPERGPLAAWRRLRQWLGMDDDGPAKAIYRQANRYDGAGRLTDIERGAAVRPASDAPARGEHYDYDRMDRLTQMRAGDGALTRLRYDRGGNRTSEQLTPAPAAPSHAAAPSAAAPGTSVRDYRYQPGTNRLIAVVQAGRESPQAAPIPTAPNNGAGAAQLIRAAWLYHPTGVPLARFDGGTPAGGRRVVYNTARRPVAVYDARNRLMARYRYNLQGERIAKTVYPHAGTGTPQALATKVAAGARADAGRTTYSLYREQRLAAEADGDGNITAHYVYLDGKPIAKIAMAPDLGVAHRIWRSLATLGGLWPHDRADWGDTVAAIHAIHTDHLGTPQVVTDERQQVVWQADTDAFGKATLAYAAATATGNNFEMNLRLPGQLFDAETGLHYNYLRDYDPQLGRYLTPDPMGLGGGVNPYSYVSNNPLTNVDPLGLYEEDIHYYMTYFLARAAGVDAQMAYIIATGAQYIDNNPITYPMNSSYFTAAWDIIADNAAVQNRLASYHFTQTAADDNSADAKTRYKNPGNAQLTRLFDASIKAGDVGSLCAKAVMYGEYLHAFEDTFAHRRYDNTPVGINGGLGHAVYGHMPDHTYNETQIFGHDWLYNEDRSLEMEHEVFDRLSSTWGDGKSQAHDWSEFEELLKRFNKTRESSDNTGDFAGTSEKVDILNAKLNEWEYKFVGIDGKEKTIDLTSSDDETGQYKIERGAADRKNFLRYKEDGDGHKADAPFLKTDPNFNGTILP